MEKGNEGTPRIKCKLCGKPITGEIVQVRIYKPNQFDADGRSVFSEDVVCCQRCYIIMLELYADTEGIHGEEEQEEEIGAVLFPEHLRQKFRDRQIEAETEAIREEDNREVSE